MTPEQRQALHDRLDHAIDAGIMDAGIMGDDSYVDIPFEDGTDFAHPAWWRGHDAAVERFQVRIAELEADNAEWKRRNANTLRLLHREVDDHAEELFRADDKFRAMHRRAQMWEKRARVWSKWRDGVEYWIRQWQSAYAMQSYYFEKWFDARQENDTLCRVIELLRTELEKEQPR